VIVIGGASRSGKGVLSRRLMVELGIPAWPIDPIKMALSRAIPDYPLRLDGSSEAVSRGLWPFVRTLILNMIETGVEAIIEGEVLPEHVVELRQTARVSACFLGYAEMDPLEKARLIRNHGGYPNDWTADLPFEQLVELAEAGISFSRFIRDECRRFDLPYVDLSGNFELAQNEAFTIVAVKRTGK